MNVALYYPWLYLTSGAERSILELTRHSRHTWTLYTSRFEPESTFPGLSKCDVRVLDRVPVRRSVVATALNCLRILTRRIPLNEHDALVVVCEGLGDLVVFRNDSRPAVCVCLTPLRVAFDHVYREHALARRLAMSAMAANIGAAMFRVVDRIAWKRYSRILCISREAKDRAVAGGLARADQIGIAHPGLGFQPPEPSTTSDRFFFLPGRIMWTKNIELAIRAFAEFQKRNPDLSDFRLVVAGMVDRKSESYLARLRMLAANVPGIEFRVAPTDEELERLYRSCYAVLFTAFNEDWGIVPIEGMSFGKPVIAVNRGGPRESVGHGTHGFLEEPDPDAFAYRMTQLARDHQEARAMGAAAHKHSKRFSWANFADAVDSSVEEAVQAFRAKQRPAIQPRTGEFAAGMASRRMEAPAHGTPQMVSAHEMQSERLER